MWKKEAGKKKLPFKKKEKIKRKKKRGENMYQCKRKRILAVSFFRDDKKIQDFS